MNDTTDCSLGSARRRIGLVIDDDPGARHILMRALGHLDIGAIGFASGEGALAWAELNRAPDIVTVDLQLPAMCGLRVCEWFRNMPATRAVPLIVVTARARATDEADAHALGAAYLAKPFRLHDFTARVSSLLASPSPSPALPIVPSAAPQAVHFWSRDRDRDGALAQSVAFER